MLKVIPAYVSGYTTKQKEVTFCHISIEKSTVDGKFSIAFIVNIIVKFLLSDKTTWLGVDLHHIHIC